MIKSPFVKESVLRNLDTCIPRMSYLIPYGKINSKGIKSKTKNYKTTKIKSKKLVCLLVFSLVAILVGMRF